MFLEADRLLCHGVSSTARRGPAMVLDDRRAPPGAPGIWARMVGGAGRDGRWPDIYILRDVVVCASLWAVRGRDCQGSGTLRGIATLAVPSLSGGGRIPRGSWIRGGSRRWASMGP